MGDTRLRDISRIDRSRRLGRPRATVAKERFDLVQMVLGDRPGTAAPFPDLHRRYTQRLAQHLGTGAGTRHQRFQFPRRHTPDVGTRVRRNALSREKISPPYSTILRRPPRRGVYPAAADRQYYVNSQTLDPRA